MDLLPSIRSILCDPKTSLTTGWVLLTFEADSKTPSIFSSGTAFLDTINFPQALPSYLVTRALLYESEGEQQITRVKIALVQLFPPSCPRRLKLGELGLGHLEFVKHAFPGFSFSLTVESLEGLEMEIKEKLLSGSGSFKPKKIVLGVEGGTTLPGPLLLNSPSPTPPTSSRSLPPPPPPSTITDTTATNSSKPPPPPSPPAAAFPSLPPPVTTTTPPTEEEGGGGMISDPPPPPPPLFIKLPLTSHTAMIAPLYSSPPTGGSPGKSGKGVGGDEGGELDDKGSHSPTIVPLEEDIPSPPPPSPPPTITTTTRVDTPFPAE